MHVGDALQKHMPPGTDLKRGPGSWLVGRGKQQVRVRTERRKRGTRLHLSIATPSTYIPLILLGIFPYFIAAMMYEKKVGPFAEEIRLALMRGLGQDVPPQPDGQ